MLPEDFPAKDLLVDYDSIEEVSEASDEELLAIEEIGPATLKKIREVAPHSPSPDETGSGEVSGTISDMGGSIHPTSESFEKRTSRESKDRTDPITGQDLPKGITKNERGTLTASSTVDQADMVHPDRIKKEREARLRDAGQKISSLMEGI